MDALQGRRPADGRQMGGGAGNFVAMGEVLTHAKPARAMRLAAGRVRHPPRATAALDPDVTEQALSATSTVASGLLCAHGHAGVCDPKGCEYGPKSGGRIFRNAWGRSLRGRYRGT